MAFILWTTQAYEIIKSEFRTTADAKRVMDALIKGYELSVPNLALALSGRTCVMIDCSGSMHTPCFNGKSRMNSTVSEKAGLIAATIAKSTGADVVRFGSRAEMTSYNKDMNVFDLGKKLSIDNMGGTNIAAAVTMRRLRRRKNPKASRIRRRISLAPAWPVWRRPAS